MNDQMIGYDKRCLMRFAVITIKRRKKPSVLGWTVRSEEEYQQE